MLARVRSHLVGNAVGYLALFIALGGTSYAVATGSIDSREIKNNVVSSKDLRNNGVRGVDVRNRTLRGGDVRPGSLTGVQIDEATLGEVASAASAARAGDADLLGGRGPGTFAPANPAAKVDVAEGAAETRVMALPGFGELVVDSCDTTAPVGFDFAWRNTTGTDQDLWAHLADTDDPSLPPQHGELLSANPDTEFTVTLNAGAEVMSTFLISPRDGSGNVATLSMFATVGKVPGVCRVAVQAVLSRSN